MQETAHQERRKATYQDLMEVPNHLVAEIIDGELITSPRPAPRHALTSSVLLSDLMGPFHFGTGGGGEGPGGWWILHEPEPHLWLIDPLARTLEVYRLKADGWFVESTHAGAERVRVEPFDAEELDMNRWWLPPAAGEGREDVPPDQTGK